MEAGYAGGAAVYFTVRLTIHPDREFAITCVYASCLKRVRQRLWEYIDYVYATIHQNHAPWMIVGDFNVISSIMEKKGGGQTDLGAIHEFLDCIARNGLIDAGYQGENFTWCNNRRGHARIWERLDRALINVQCQAKYEALTVQHLTRVTLDHSPLLIKIDGDTPRTSFGLSFQRMWTEHPGFFSTVPGKT